MSQYFHKMIPKTSVSLQPVILSRTAHAIVKTLGTKKRNVKKEENNREENKAPIRRLRSDTHTKRIGEMTETKAKKQAIKRNTKRELVDETVKAPTRGANPQNTRLFEAVRAIKDKNKQKAQSINEKLEELGFHKKDKKTTKNISDNPIKMKLDAVNFKPAQQPYRQTSTMPVASRYQHFKSYHTEREGEEDEGDDMESAEVREREMAYLQETLLPVNNSVRHLISVQQETETVTSESDPFYAWNHPPAPSEYSFDLASSVEKVNTDNFGLKINRQRLIDRHTPWHKHRSALLENGDFSAKNTKRYVSMSHASTLNEALTTKLAKQNAVASKKDKRTMQRETARKGSMNTTRSSVSSMRTNINKHAYGKYPIKIHPQGDHAMSRYNYAANMRTKNY